MQTLSLNWYDDKSRWLDPDDYFISPQDNRYRPTTAGLASLKDHIVDREQTEYAVFKAGVYAACGKASLTRRQQEAVALAREAMRLNITPSTYVSAVLGINRHSAYKLLTRVDSRLENSNLAKMETSSKTIHMISRTRDKSPSRIRKQMAAQSVVCAALGTEACQEVAHIRYCICASCAERYRIKGVSVRQAMRQLEANPETRWLAFAIRDTWNQRYHDVIYALDIVDVDPDTILQDYAA